MNLPESIQHLEDVKYNFIANVLGDNMVLQRAPYKAYGKVMCLMGLRRSLAAFGVGHRTQRQLLRCYLRTRNIPQHLAVIPSG